MNRPGGDMQRRGESGQPTKGQRKIGPKARKAPIASVSAVDLEEQLDRRTRELDEALQQQTATSEVLSIIRRSPADPQPVFDAIVQSAARLCGAVFSVVYLCDGDHLRIAATKNFTPEATSQIYGRPELKRPDRSHTGSRAILDRAVVHIHDVLKDPEYSRELALAGGWRAVLGVPLLRDGQSVGAITVGKREPTPFSEQQIQLLKTFADQAVIAIENVRLFEAEQTRTRELSEALEQQTATSEVLKVIASSTGELQPVSAPCSPMPLDSAKRFTAPCGVAKGISGTPPRCTATCLPLILIGGAVDRGSIPAPMRRCRAQRRAANRSTSPICARIFPIAAVVRCRSPPSRLPASARCFACR